MRRSTSHVTLFLSGAVLVGACGGAGAPAGGAKIAVQVAPLTLTGITDATYRLTVTNADGQTVWSQEVDADKAGDGVGSVSYVGPCDASSSPNVVALELLELRDASKALVDGTDFVNPAPAGRPVTRSVACIANADAPVDFNLDVLRNGQQGFFDIAVDFEDLFCSAKLDCEDDQQQDLLLLSNPITGLRDTTAVVALACTAGPGQTTTLYYDDLVVHCDGGPDVVVDPHAGPGNLNPHFGPLPDTTDLLFQAATYFGDEPLAGLDAVYWNVALGLNHGAFAHLGACRLEARATASDHVLTGGATPANTVYPIVHWSVPLVDADGQRACHKHAVNAPGSGVTTDYVDGSTTFEHGLTFGGQPFSTGADGGDDGGTDGGNAPVCGNGELEPGEQCDDGNTDSEDGCSATCVLETCGDGIQNQGEGGVDCGGPCANACPTCGDGIQNQGEGGIDCGGPCTNACPTCGDGIQNEGEDGIDCGGPCANACPSCGDGIQNEGEAGIDCGGPCAAVCPTCDDGIENQGEGGIDCGGPCSTPCLVANRLLDVNAQPVGSSPQAFATVTSGAWFEADDGSHGPEMWRAHCGGTPSVAMGPEMVAGSGGGAIVSRYDQTAQMSRQLITSSGDTIAFITSQGDFDSATDVPWVEDDAGLHALAGYPNTSFSDLVGPFLGSKAVFFATVASMWGGGAATLYASPRDGSALVELGDYDTLLGVAGGNVVFTRDGAPWVSDGTVDGTQELAQVAVDDASGAASTNGRLYFAATDETGAEPWVSDGTSEGTRRLVDLLPGAEGSGPTLFTSAGDHVFFVASPDGATQQVFVATASDVEPFASAIEDGFEATAIVPGHLGDAWLVTPNGLYHATAGGTALVPGSAGIRGAVAAGGHAWFELASDPTGEVYATDGASTLDLGVASTTYNWPLHATACDGALLFAGTDAAHAEEPWVSDGTVAGTALVSDVNAVATPGSNPNTLTVIGGTLYFTADDGSNGSEPWKTDGTAGGTVRIGDINPGTGASSPDVYFGWQGQILMRASDANNNRHMWRYAPSSGVVDEIDTLYNPYPLGTIGGSLLFRGYDGGSCDCTYRLDASFARSKVNNFSMFVGQRLQAVQALSGALIAVSTDGSEPIHRIDASTFATTTLANGQYPGDLTPFQGQVYMQRSADGTHVDMWRTTGAAGDGLEQVGPQGFQPDAMAGIGDTLWINGKTDSDPSSNTRQLYALRPPYTTPELVLALDGAGGANPRFITEVAGLGFCFYANTAAAGQEIWCSDGTVDGSRMVVDTIPGPTSNLDFSVGIVPLGDGRFAFVAQHPQLGTELWVSDGTPGGTRVVDLARGAAGSNPQNLVMFQGKLWFTADDGVKGTELYVFDPTAQ